MFPKIVMSSSMSSYLHQILHQDTHVTPPDAHVPQDVLVEQALHELPVVNQQQPAYPAKPLGKFRAFSEQARSTGYEPTSHDKGMLSYDQSTDYVFDNGAFLTVPDHMSRKASIVSASSASPLTELIKKEHPHHSSVLLSMAKPVASKEKREDLPTQSESVRTFPSSTGDVLVTQTCSARRNPLQIECVFRGPLERKSSQDQSLSKERSRSTESTRIEQRET